ncbi:MAG: hypothetical protein QNJ34_02380 [Xenococcaceae cyanobacterium MO_188.B29]|nr:hypothetical protein [Xenococcaceae cyanobacterium MO_188.B29]
MRANSKLETCLTKAIYAFKVREILTKFGVPENAEVTLELQIGENSEPCACCQIPTTVKKDHIQCGSMSLSSFQHSVMDDFINPALNTLDLGQYIPDDEEKFAKGESPMKVVFRSNSPSFSMDVTTSSYCCCRLPNGSCCCSC